jgi:hypothetical protein
MDARGRAGELRLKADCSSFRSESSFVESRLSRRIPERMLLLVHPFLPLDPSRSSFLMLAQGEGDRIKRETV